MQKPPNQIIKLNQKCLIKKAQEEYNFCGTTFRFQKKAMDPNLGFLEVLKYLGLHH